MIRLLVATVVSLAGTSMVFALLLVMNATAEAPQDAPAQTAVAMSVAPKPKPPPRKAAQRPKPNPAAPQPLAPPPPAPAVGGGLPSVSLGMALGEVAFDDPASAELFGAVKASVMTEDTVDSKPRPVRRTAAQYPARARAKGVTGFVTMSLLVGERGEVERIKVLRADPPGVFDQAAQEAIRAWQFEPATYGGEPVKVWATQTIRFELK